MEAKEVEVTEVGDAVAAEVVVTNLLAAEAASNAGKKAIFRENAPTNQQVAVVSKILNITKEILA